MRESPFHRQNYSDEVPGTYGLAISRHPENMPLSAKLHMVSVMWDEFQLVMFVAIVNNFLYDVLIVCKCLHIINIL